MIVRRFSAVHGTLLRILLPLVCIVIIVDSSILSNTNDALSSQDKNMNNVHDENVKDSNDDDYSICRQLLQWPPTTNINNHTNNGATSINFSNDEFEIVRGKDGRELKLLQGGIPYQVRWIQVHVLHVPSSVQLVDWIELNWIEFYLCAHMNSLLSSQYKLPGAPNSAHCQLTTEYCYLLLLPKHQYEHEESNVEIRIQSKQCCRRRRKQQ